MATRRFPKGPTVIAITDTRVQPKPEVAEDPFKDGETTPLTDRDLTRMQHSLLGGEAYEIEVAHILKLITELRYRRSVMEAAEDDGDDDDSRTSVTPTW